VDARGAPIASEQLAAELDANPALAPLLAGPTDAEAERRQALIRDALH
jgi:hypothetical protein